MTNKPRAMVVLLVLLAASLVVPAVSAVTVQYPEEYQQIKNQADNYANKLLIWDVVTTDFTILSQLTTAFELRCQSILLEKQNELLAEQNHILWVQTCYRPYDFYRSGGNGTALYQECQQAGYPV